VVAAVAGLLDDPAVAAFLWTGGYTPGDVTAVLGGFGDAGIRVVVGRLRSPVPEVREGAAGTLGRLRTRARAALPDLRDAARTDPDPRAAAAAAAAAAGISLDP